VSIEAKGSSKCEVTTINAGVSAMSQLSSNDVIILPPGAGRPYDVTPMRSIFKADGVETDERYSASEWWLEAGQPGPGPHSHEATVHVDEDWFVREDGTFVRVAYSSAAIPLPDGRGAVVSFRDLPPRGD
jgi:hypothetical protein